MLRSIVAMSGAALLLGLSAGPAQALTDKLITAHVPFAFHVEGTRLPAGDYVLKPMDLEAPGVIEIRSTDVHGPAAAVLTIPESISSADQPQLRFDDVGKQHFLRGIEYPGETGLEIPVTAAEVNAAREAAEQAHATSPSHS